MKLKSVQFTFDITNELEILSHELLERFWIEVLNKQIYLYRMEISFSGLVQSNYH